MATGKHRAPAPKGKDRQDSGRLDRAADIPGEQLNDPDVRARTTQGTRRITPQRRGS